MIVPMQPRREVARDAYVVTVRVRVAAKDVDDALLEARHAPFEGTRHATPKRPDKRGMRCDRLQILRAALSTDDEKAAPEEVRPRPYGATARHLAVARPIRSRAEADVRVLAVQ